MMPMRVLHRMYELSIHIPTQFVATPLKALDMELASTPPWGRPMGPHLPVPLLVRGARDVHGHVVALVVGGGFAT